MTDKILPRRYTAIDKACKDGDYTVYNFVNPPIDKDAHKKHHNCKSELPKRPILKLKRPLNINNLPTNNDKD